MTLVTCYFIEKKAIQKRSMIEGRNKSIQSLIEAYLYDDACSSRPKYEDEVIIVWESSHAQLARTRW